MTNPGTLSRYPSVTGRSRKGGFRCSLARMPLNNITNKPTGTRCVCTSSASPAIGPRLGFPTNLHRTVLGRSRTGTNIGGLTMFGGLFPNHGQPILDGRLVYFKHKEASNLNPVPDAAWEWWDGSVHAGPHVACGIACVLLQLLVWRRDARFFLWAV